MQPFFIVLFGIAKPSYILRNIEARCGDEEVISTGKFRQNQAGCS